jgi:hypothetical protein
MPAEAHTAPWLTKIAAGPIVSFECRVASMDANIQDYACLPKARSCNRLTDAGRAASVEDVPMMIRCPVASHSHESAPKRC